MRSSAMIIILIFFITSCVYVVNCNHEIHLNEVRPDVNGNGRISGIFTLINRYSIFFSKLGYFIENIPTH